MQSKTLTGSHLKLYVNGQYVGIIVGGQVLIDTPLKPARGVDSPFVHEWMPTTVAVQGMMNVVRLHGDGGLEGAGLTVFPEELLLQKYLTFDFVDRRNERVTFHIEQVLTEGQQWSFAAKTVVQGSFRFQGVTASNEVAT